MANPVENKTLVVLGHARQADAFQCGREAAQMAKSQLHNSPPSLVLAFGPDNLRFKDLIEGVRLVTGEDALIGIPAHRVLSREFSSHDSAVVLMIQSPTPFAVASAPTSADRPVVTATAIQDQFRERRGNVRKNFKEHGRLIFSNATPKAAMDAARLISAEGSTDSWAVGVKTQAPSGCTLVCGDKTISDGLAAIECLGDTPWGVGEVAIGEFRSF
jgi:hypothetical protein